MGRKEENIKKAQTLLHQKERIRNIGTAAHIDHGKCVTAESRIWLNGGFAPATYGAGLLIALQYPTPTARKCATSGQSRCGRNRSTCAPALFSSPS